MRTPSYLFLVLLFFTQTVCSEIANTDSFNSFITRMVRQHHYNESELRQLFQQVEIQPAILDAMSKPAEAKPWFAYRQIFMTESRISAGVDFWNQHQDTLKSVEQRFGVPAEIIIAILGVETKYGTNTGRYRVMDALSTLGFAYPKRSEFFLKELEQYLLLTRDEGIDPLSVKGSYAGAMGFPQFMPSSFRGFAADFEHDQHRDIWKNPADAIASVANYFQHNHWQTGKPVAFQLEAHSNNTRLASTKGIKPDTTVGKIKHAGIKVPKLLPDHLPARLLSYDMGDQEQLWLVTDNFYVITRYNHSPLYAMAVFQLAEAIRERRQING
ncbi:MAG: lytic murein transglycosylase B [Methylococcaceae bacterium]|nr:lytic murein transglycosylase B [Methylococcaceae bacterium]